MAILQAILTGISRSLGRVLNTVFGWATMMLFGKVPQDRQIYLSLIAFGSVIWLVTALGVAFPSLGTILLAFIPLPDWINENWVRAAMLAAAVMIPAVTGHLATKLVDSGAKVDAGKLQIIARGYLFTLGLAITLVLLTLFAPILKLRAVSRRWVIEHIPLVVEPEDYQVVVNEVQQTLETTGWKTRREPAPWMLTVPTKVLTTIAGSTASKLIGEQLVTLVSSDLEVILHPSDMAISGKKTEVGRVRAALAHQLAFSTAYLTWNKDANMLEDRIRGVWNELRSSHDGEIPPQSIRELAEIEEAMRKAELPYEEWQTLDRAKLLVERGMLQMLAGVVSVRPEPQGMSPERMGARQIERANSESGRWVTDAASIAFFAVLAWLGFTRPKDSHVSR